MKLKVNLYFDKDETTEDLMRLIETAFKHLRKDVEEGKTIAWGVVTNGDIVVNDETNDIIPD